ncbi:hypothetical protein ACLOJK_013452 [Asimina triloba]
MRGRYASKSRSSRVSSALSSQSCPAAKLPFLSNLSLPPLDVAPAVSPTLACSTFAAMEVLQFQGKDRRHDALGDLRVLPDEILCVIPEYLTPRDIARLSTVFAVVVSLNVSDEFLKRSRKPRHFDGFNSLFLYRRWYRCFAGLSSFDFDKGVLERKKNLSIDEFVSEYDAKKPVLLTDLAETWPARSTWTTDQLIQNYGDTPFKISQRSSKKITMKLKDYVAYTKLQHDEDPLYIFDDKVPLLLKFGEVAPGLLKDYSVPYLFQEDFFDVLDVDQRPAFRWLIIGPERSGASWHVDPALTSRVPLGVTVNVNEEDGDVNIDTPSSLQWWLDFYPLLADEDKPIECTQLPGETIFVPSGWWHCVLNLETTIAVTQNFVNKSNFEFVCLDFAPGYRHKGVCRAGLLALDDNCSVTGETDFSCAVDHVSLPDKTRKEKRRRISKHRKELCEDDDDDDGNATNGFLKSSKCSNSQEFAYDINYLSSFLDEDRDHYNFVWSESNCIGQREMRQWLHKLWVAKPEMRDLVWKGASLAVNVNKWSACLAAICGFHNLPSPTDDEKLPVGTGSNPLEFYALLEKVRSPLRKYIPDVFTSGILLHENGLYRTVPWNGKGNPDLIAQYDLLAKNFTEDGFLFGVWNKQQLELERGEKLPLILDASSRPQIWPYLVTKRCKGNILADIRDELTWDDFLNLASFLGSQLYNLHILPLPPMCDSTYSVAKNEMTLVRPGLGNSEKGSSGPVVSASTEATIEISSIPVEWDLFAKTLIRRRKDISSRLAKWGSPIPSRLIEKVEEYIPHDIMVLLNDKNDQHKVSKSPTWIHSDIMDDNIHMESSVACCLDADGLDASLTNNGTMNSHNGNAKQRKWNPSYILDFSDLSIGDPLLDLIPIHVDVFRGDSRLLNKLLQNYQLPFARRPSGDAMHGVECKYQRLSYCAISFRCYCILHDENVLGAIFSLQKELRSAKSWEEVEDVVWGELNDYQSFY